MIKITPFIFILFTCINFKLKAQDKYNLNLGMIVHTPSHFSISIKPYLGVTLNEKYEFGVSYIQSGKSDKLPHSPTKSLDEQKNYFGLFSKIYLGGKKNFTLQLGYNKLKENNDRHLLITDTYPIHDPYGNIIDYYTGNDLQIRTFNSNISWGSFSCGYSINPISRIFIEPQISYLFIKKKEEKYIEQINNIFDPVSPDNFYEITDGKASYSSEFQLNLLITYKI